MTLIVRGSQSEPTARPVTGAGAHAEGTVTAVSGANAHGEGELTTASGTDSHAEGISCQATGSYSHAEGNLAVAAGQAGHAEGESTAASGTNSHAQGRYAVAHRYGQHAHAAGRFVAAGDAQAVLQMGGHITVDATPLVLTTGNAGTVTLGATSSTVLTVVASRAYRFRIEAVARNNGADEVAGFTITGTIARHSSGNARFVSTPAVTTDADAAASAWTLAVSIDTSNATYNYLVLTATGAAAKTIRWIAAIYATEAG